MEVIICFTHQNNSVHNRRPNAINLILTFRGKPDADECEQCTKILEELENIDDDCDRHGITFVKTRDFSVAEQYGVHDYPALVYFEGGIPNVFEGKKHYFETHLLRGKQNNNAGSK